LNAETVVTLGADLRENARSIVCSHPLMNDAAPTPKCPAFSAAVSAKKRLWRQDK
jgi:hypothetical protein